MSETFRTNSRTNHETTTSGILEEVFDLQRCQNDSATHFVLCKGEKLRFLIHLKSGLRPLHRAVMSYGGKMALLLRLLSFLPYQLLSWGGLGYFARVQLHPAVADTVPSGHEWNALIGTYSDRQKVVFQAFPPNNARHCIYIKVGNIHSEKQMQTEIAFLRQNHDYRLMTIPKLLGMKLRDKDCPFNIMVTEEFSGEKVAPKLTPEIYALYKELSQETQTVNQQLLVRSHGDFAPWNIRRQGTKHTVFDWEFCGWRPRGYDLVHFLTIVGMNLEHKDFSDAYDDAMSVVRTYEPDISMNKEAFYREFTELMQF